MPRLVLDHLDLLALYDQGADVVEGDVPALGGVVQAPVRVFLDQTFLAHEEAVYLTLPALHQKQKRAAAPGELGHRSQGTVGIRRPCGRPAWLPRPSWRTEPGSRSQA